jgi:hypothetical protein
MRVGIYALFCITLAAGLAELLLPGRDGSGVKRGLRLLVALAVLLLVAQPLRGLLTGDRWDLSALFEAEETLTADYEKIFESAVGKRFEEDLRTGLYGWLSAEYGLEVKDAQIRILFAEDDALKRIEITLSGKGLLQNPYEIEQALSQKFNCEAEVR